MDHLPHVPQSHEQFYKIERGILDLWCWQMLRRERLRSTLRMGVQSFGEWKLIKLFWRMMGSFGYKLKELAQVFAWFMTHMVKTGGGDGRRTRMLCLFPSWYWHRVPCAYVTLVKYFHNMNRRPLCNFIRQTLWRHEGGRWMEEARSWLHAWMGVGVWLIICGM